ncbi:MAG: hypothetical protein IH621_16580 [Krumholzibacteria bacterium]|nr:hypothetical protein [Candidatus Krumholzibacteria bacterium]
MGYSWANPGGAGWSYFPLTGDDRVPNSPNVYVEADFDMGRGTTVARTDIRLDGVFSVAALNFDNSHTAVFEYPIPNCGDVDLRVEYRLELQGGGEAWYPLDTHYVTRASDVDWNGSGSIDVGDLSAFSSCMGSCAGDGAYQPCFDILKGTEDCIDIADAGAMSELLYMAPDKAIVDGGEGASVVGGVCDMGSDCAPIRIVSANPWNVAIVEFDATGGELVWEPNTLFADRSVLIQRPGMPGHYGLFVYRATDGGEIELGTVYRLADKSSATGRVVGAVIGAGEDLESHSEGVKLPRVIATIANTPNPFNPMTTISLNLPDSDFGQLAVYAVSGQLIKVLNYGQLGAGLHEYRWDGRNSAGRSVAAGSYLYRYASVSGRVLTGKMTLLK